MASPPDDTRRRRMRETLLVVAALITAVTFQAGVNPPGGVWQDDEKYANGTLLHNGTLVSNGTILVPDGHKAGSAIYASHKHAFYIFLTFNTLALSTSILLLITLTFSFRYRFEVLVATLCMFATYASAIFAITPAGSADFRFLLITAAAPFIIRVLVKIFKNGATVSTPTQDSEFSSK